MHRFWLRIATGLLMACAERVVAQSGTHTVRGVIYDSIAGRPLVGAVVQVAVVGTTTAPLSATTDSAGGYHVFNVHSGQVVVGFYHDALTALGLDAPVRAVELLTDSVVVVDLGIPSSATIRKLRCGESSPFASGMLVGAVRDAESHGAPVGAKLTLAWKALALDAGNYRIVTERASATIEEDGSLLACDLPLEVPLDLAVSAPGHRAVAGPVVTVPSNGIGRLDLVLADSALTSGTAMIRGRVLRESGKPVTTGRVVLEALDRDVPVREGAFVVPNVPEGTWSVEARVIGAEPQTKVATTVESAVSLVNFTVSDHAQRLDVVSVVGKPGPQLRLLDEVLRRKRTGMGTTFLPGSPLLQTATWIVDVMKEARGFRFRSPTDIRGRLDCKPVAVYVDDMRIPDGFADVGLAVTPSEVLAIETWPDMALAPVQYRVAAHGCALVLIWTKRAF